jgi:hypothetical protein
MNGGTNPRTPRRPALSMDADHARGLRWMPRPAALRPRGDPFTLPAAVQAHPGPRPQADRPAPAARRLSDGGRTFFRVSRTRFARGELFPIAHANKIAVGLR